MSSSRAALLWLCGGGLLSSVSGCQLRKFDFSEPRTLTARLDGISVVRVDAGAGFLRIEGRNNTTELLADAVARAGSPAMLQRVRLDVRRAGDTLVIISAVPADREPVGQAAALDLTLAVPRTMRLDVVDRSGETIVRGVGPLRITHGDGNLDIDGVAGDLDVHDGDGDMVIMNVHGDANIVDAGGGIYVTNVTGSVAIPIDGAGDIQIASVLGNVTVGTKRSGEVRARGVGGNLLVNATGSGTVQYRDVKGKVTIPSDRSLTQGH